MKNIKIYIATLSTVVFAFLFVADAQAQLDRSFVSTTGTDSATCGDQISPCRDFNAALSRTNGGGEVITLDSGIYALTNITVTKGVTLTAAPGIHADLYNTTDNNRITVDTGASGTVVLRNLYIKGKPGGTNAYGIGVAQVGSLQVENCVIDRFSQGIGSSAMQNSADFFIKDTIIKNSLSSGIEINTSAGLVRAVVDHCQFVNNGTSGIGDGITVTQRGRVSVRDSIATSNAGAGFIVVGGDLSLDNCESSNNDYGVYAGSSETNSGTATVSNSLVTNNKSFGFRQAGNGVFNSLGNNTVRRNAANTTGTINTVSGT
jgi:hypothetical protein